MIHDLKKNVPRAWYFIVWGFLLFGAQIIDKPHLFKVSLKSLIEVTMELGAAMMMVFILLSFPLNVRRLFRQTIQLAG